MGILAYDSTGRRPWSTRECLLAIAAGACAAHFAMSVIAWSMLLMPVGRPRLIAALVGCAPALGPCLVLCAVAARGLWAALRRRAGVARWLVTLVLLSAATFAYDVSRRRYQIHVTLSRHAWEQGYLTEVYCTWWWYNNRWAS